MVPNTLNLTELLQNSNRVQILTCFVHSVALVTVGYDLLLEISFLDFCTSISLLLPTSLTIFLCQLSECWSVSSILALCFWVILSSIMTVNTFHLCLTPKYLFVSPKLSLGSKLLDLFEYLIYTLVQNRIFGFLSLNLFFFKDLSFW